MPEDIRLSAIIPLYNAGEMFRNFMDSLVAQTLTSLEIIIVNDGSTDGSDLVAQEYAERYSHITVISQPNGGFPSHVTPGSLPPKAAMSPFPTQMTFLILICIRR